MNHLIQNYHKKIKRTKISLLLNGRFYIYHSQKRICFVNIIFSDVQYTTLVDVWDKQKDIYTQIFVSFQGKSAKDEQTR